MEHPAGHVIFRSAVLGSWLQRLLSPCDFLPETSVHDGVYDTIVVF